MRLLAEVQLQGNEDGVIHLGEEIGSRGIIACMEHANRVGRLICAHAARYIERPWAVMLTLARALGNRDRQYAARSAESLVVILSELAPFHLGADEVLDDEIEILLRQLRSIALSPLISDDIRVQALQAENALSRLVDGGLATPREVLSRGTELGSKRAAVASLLGSIEADDVAALSQAALHERDLFTVALAAAGICEATMMHGRNFPEGIDELVVQLLRNPNARPSIIGPLLACLARSRPRDRTTRFRELAANHPHPGSRATWTTLTSQKAAP